MDVIDVSLFYGDDDRKEWVSWIEEFCAQGYSDLEKLQFGFVEEDALAWYNGETSQSPFTSWVDFKICLFQRFSKDSEIEALLKQKRAIDFERRMRILERLEKLLLPTEDRLEKENLGGEEKKNTSLGNEEELFEFVNTKRKEEHQEEEQKQIEDEMDNCAHQVFDKMILSGKRVKKKRKKKKFMEPK
ncbi:myosin-M heavy chain-like isoform X2 [Eutrema salsugineum]|uniref:myosin-M heavy chain-like isoform X2 n=1 Tax=Eutrema salsugineum TaxID=72664 RepID=UPI000CED0AF1|nr:myosin-M heavy chain-like isoform X2 [Eutrema salsugineum]